MNIAIVGCGAAGAELAHAAQRAHCVITACADTSRVAARAFAGRFSSTPATWKAIKKRAGLDAILLATPTAKHEALVLEALIAKLPILIASPLAPTFTTASKLHRAAQRAKVPLSIGPLSHHDSAIAAITARLTSGAVGKSGFIRIMRSGPALKGQGYTNDTQGGGVLLNQLLVDFEWIASQFGSPTRVYCQRVQRTRPDFIDYALVTLRLPNDCIAQLIGSWAHESPPRHRLEICGDNGMIQFDSAQPTVTFEARNSGDTSNEDTPTSLNAYDHCVREFLSRVKSGKKSDSCNAHYKALAIATAAARSATTGRAQRIAS